MSVYVLDTNFFIQAHRVSYPLDIAFSFWNKVKQLAFEGKIISIDKVKQEIFQNDDALKQWCENNLPDDFFRDTTKVVNSYGQVATWAVSRSEHYFPSALAEFLDADEADAWLVSYALADNSDRIIITHELSEPNRKNKVKIPEACLAFNVRFANVIEMFRQLKETF